MLPSFFPMKMFHKHIICINVYIISQQLCKPLHYSMLTMQFAQLTENNANSYTNTICISIWFCWHFQAALYIPSDGVVAPTDLVSTYVRLAKDKGTCVLLYQTLTLIRWYDSQQKSVKELMIYTMTFSILNHRL